MMVNRVNPVMVVMVVLVDAVVVMVAARVVLVVVPANLDSPVMLAVRVMMASVVQFVV